MQLRLILCRVICMQTIYIQNNQSNDTLKADLCIKPLFTGLSAQTVLYGGVGGAHYQHHYQQLSLSTF